MFLALLACGRLVWVLGLALALVLALVLGVVYVLWLALLAVLAHSMGAEGNTGSYPRTSPATPLISYSPNALYPPPPTPRN